MAGATVVTESPEQDSEAVQLPAPTGVCAHVVHLPPGAAEKLPVVLPRSKLSTHAPYPNPSGLCKSCLCTALSSFHIRFPTSLDHSHRQINELPSYLPSLKKILWRHIPLRLIPHHFMTLYSKMLQKVDYKRCLQFLSSHSCSFSSLIQSGSWGH